MLQSFREFPFDIKRLLRDHPTPTTKKGHINNSRVYALQQTTLIQFTLEMQYAINFARLGALVWIVIRQD